MKATKFLIFSLLVTTLTCIGCLPFLNNDDDNEPMVELPTIIQNYLSTNYPDYKIDESEKEVDCTGAEVYEVELESSNDDEIELTFDLEGSLLYTETEINQTDLPEAVLNTLTTEYADYTIDDAERLDLATDSVEYEVELEKDKTELDVRLSAAGTVICEEVDED